MFHLVRFDSILRHVVAFVVVVSILIHYGIQYILFPHLALYKVILISSSVAAVCVYIFLSPLFYRKVWKALRKWNNGIFSDLNGTWQGTINPSTGGVITVRAVIRQSLLATQIDLHGETVKSITLAASPMIESGQHKLYYVYRAEPKQVDRPPYSGTTNLAVRAILSKGEVFLALSGQYYTDRDTCGTIELKQIGSDPSEDVSFY